MFHKESLSAFTVLSIFGFIQLACGRGTCEIEPQIINYELGQSVLITCSYSCDEHWNRPEIPGWLFLQGDSDWYNDLTNDPINSPQTCVDRNVSRVTRGIVLSLTEVPQDLNISLSITIHCGVRYGNQPWCSDNATLHILPPFNETTVSTPTVHHNMTTITAYEGNSSIQTTSKYQPTSERTEVLPTTPAFDSSKSLTFNPHIMLIGLISLFMSGFC